MAHVIHIDNPLMPAKTIFSTCKLEEKKKREKTFDFTLL